MLFSCVQERTASRRLKVSLDGRTLEYIAHAMSNGSASESGNRRLTQWPEKQKLEDSYRGDVLQTKPDRGFMGTTHAGVEKEAETAVACSTSSILHAQLHKCIYGRIDLRFCV